MAAPTVPTILSPASGATVSGVVPVMCSESTIPEPPPPTELAPDAPTGLTITEVEAPTDPPPPEELAPDAPTALTITEVV